MSPVQVAKEWWLGTPLQRFTMVCGAVSATVAALVALMHFGQIAEPYWIATRSFTRELVQTAEKGTGIRLLSLEIASKEADRNNTQSQIDRVEAELAKLPHGTNETLRSVLSDQLLRYKRQLELLDFEINDLRRMRSGRRP